MSLGHLAAESKLAKAEPDYREALTPRQVVNPVAEAFAQGMLHEGRALGALGCPQIGVNTRIHAGVGAGVLWYACGPGDQLGFSSGQLARLTLPGAEMKAVDLAVGGEYVPVAFSDIAYGLGFCADDQPGGELRGRDRPGQ